MATETKIEQFTFEVDPTAKWKGNHPTIRAFHAKTIRQSFGADIHVPKTSGFLDACIRAYNEHLHLILRPDDIWLTLMIAFATYVEQHAEQLRDRFVAFGKKQLVVKGGGSMATADFAGLCRRMGAEVAANIKNPKVKKWIIPSFSTTTPIDQVVGAIVLMGAMKKFFDYKFQLMCGLPQVTMLGTVEDWQEIERRAKQLQDYDVDGKMKAWFAKLQPVLHKLTESRRGHPDPKWWNRIVHHEGGGSGPRYLSGWLNVFMPFTNEGKWALDPPRIDTDDLPVGTVEVPVLVDDNGTEYHTLFFAGTLGVDFQRVGSQGYTAAPVIGWYMTTVPPQCPQGHRLHQQQPLYRWQCDGCDVLGSKEPYHCEKCKYDLCEDCYNKE